MNNVQKYLEVGDIITVHDVSRYSTYDPLRILDVGLVYEKECGICKCFFAKSPHRRLVGAWIANKFIDNELNEIYRYKRTFYRVVEKKK